jgi:hypothetical protein
MQQNLQQRQASTTGKKREYTAPASVAKKIMVNSVMLTQET